LVLRSSWVFMGRRLPPQLTSGTKWCNRRFRAASSNYPGAARPEMICRWSGHRSDVSTKELLPAKKVQGYTILAIATLLLPKTCFTYPWVQGKNQLPPLFPAIFRTLESQDLQLTGNRFLHKTWNVLHLLLVFFFFHLPCTVVKPQWVDVIHSLNT